MTTETVDLARVGSFIGAMLLLRILVPVVFLFSLSNTRIALLCGRCLNTVLVLLLYTMIIMRVMMMVVVGMVVSILEV